MRMRPRRRGRGAAGGVGVPARRAGMAGRGNSGVIGMLATGIRVAGAVSTAVGLGNGVFFFAGRRRPTGRFASSAELTAPVAAAGDGAAVGFGFVGMETY